MIENIALEGSLSRSNHEGNQITTSSNTKMLTANQLTIRANSTFVMDSIVLFLFSFKGNIL